MPAPFSPVRTDQPDGGAFAPRVTITQWSLAGAALLLSALGYSLTSYEELAFLLLLMAPVNVLLLCLVLKETLRTWLFGKFVLVASTLVFFWLEAIDLAYRTPPFEVPPGIPVQSGQFSRDLVQQAYLYVASFQLMLLVGYSFRPRLAWVFGWLRSRVDSPSPARRVVPYLLATCAFFPLLLTYGLDVGATVEALLAARASTGPESQDIGLLHYLYFFGMYGAALLLAQGLLFRTPRRVWAIVLGGLTALPYIMGGTRHLWLFVALPALTIGVHMAHGKVGTRRVLRWAALFLLVLIVVQLQFALRELGWKEIENLTPVQLLQGTPTGQFTALLFAQHLVPDVHDYFYESTAPYFVIHWIPRAFWPDKPVMRSWAYYNDEYTRGAAFNVTPSVIGQYHLNWGSVGVLLIGAWLGFLAALADRAFRLIDIHRQQAMAVAVGMFYAFIVSSFRFYSPIYFTYFVFSVAGMLLLTETDLALRKRMPPGVAARSRWWGRRAAGSGVRRPA